MCKIRSFLLGWERHHLDHSSSCEILIGGEWKENQEQRSCEWKLKPSSEWNFEACDGDDGLDLQPVWGASHSSTRGTLQQPLVLGGNSNILFPPCCMHFYSCFWFTIRRGERRQGSRRRMEEKWKANTNVMWNTN